MPEKILFESDPEVVKACDTLSAMLQVAVHYNRYDLVPLNPQVRNPILESFLARSVLIESVSILDHALRFRGVKGKSFAERCRAAFQQEHGLFEQLIALKDSRNECGHDPLKKVDFGVAIVAVRCIRRACQVLRYEVDPETLFTFRSERGQAREGSEGSLLVQDCYYGVDKDGIPFIRLPYTNTVMHAS